MSQQTQENEPTPMPYATWLPLMHRHGWRRYTVTTCDNGEVRIAAEWRHATATTKAGPLRVSDDEAEALRAIGETPAPF